MQYIFFTIEYMIPLIPWLLSFSACGSHDKFGNGLTWTTPRLFLQDPSLFFFQTWISPAWVTYSLLAIDAVEKCTSIFLIFDGQISSDIYLTSTRNALMRAGFATWKRDAAHCRPRHAHRTHHHLTDGTAWDAHVFSGSGFPEEFFFLLQEFSGKLWYVRFVAFDTI